MMMGSLLPAGGRERRYCEAPRLQGLRDPLDGPALAGRIPALEHGQDGDLVLVHPEVEPAQAELLGSDPRPVGTLAQPLAQIDALKHRRPLPPWASRPPGPPTAPSPALPGRAARARRGWPPRPGGCGSRRRGSPAG